MSDAHPMLTHAKRPPTDRPVDNPALSLQLRGLHLIEASAGTGKTWTLSALIVRLILEGDYMPRQMIATTFTRAAAAELRARIRQRLEHVRRVIKQLLATQATQAKTRLDAKPNPESSDATATALAMLHAEIQDDLFLAYLIQRIQVGKFGSSDHALAQNGWTHCLNRLDFALQAFDELFVGTLDSFCQKLLSEFAFESGQGERLQITEQEQELCAEILHDAVRRWRSQQDPRLIALLLQTKRLHDGTAYQYSVATVMNFLSAQLAPVSMPSLDFSRLEQLKAKLLSVDLSAFDAFIQPDGAARAGLNKKKQLYKLGGVLPSLIERLQQFGVLFLLSIQQDSPEAKLLSSFEPAALQEQFNKGNEHFRDQLRQISATNLLSELLQVKQQLTEQLDQVEQQLTFVLSQTVRERLPILLAERGETSFSQQMRRLADALDDPDNGATLAQQIRHRYPVALVDEFQDTNTDQDRVIARVYRSQPLDPAVCLILVGDPKQAIYGFRGGDVQTYLQVRAEIQQAERHGQGRLHGLTVNQRSVAPLVQAVNALFLRNIVLGDGIEYPAIQAAERRHPRLKDCTVEPSDLDNPSPLRLIQLSESKQESQQIAWQIMRLLAQAAQAELHLDGKPLQPEHIAVLGFANRELDQVQSLLQAANIAVWRPSRCSVFASAMAQDVAALLQSMLTPYHEQRLRRALSGLLIGWDLARLDQLDSDASLLIRQQMAFADEGQLWERQGFLAAWQRLAERLAVWKHLASQPEAERHLVNLRHLLELLHEQSEHSGGTHHLLSWLMRQISQPKTREWEMERRLPSQSGVQLMTIHASKGLEFPVVLVQGLDKRRKKKTDVVFYLKPSVTQRAPQRVLGFQDRTQAHLDQHHDRVEAEYRRLAYVALTRASHRLYLPLLATDKKLPTDTYAAILTYWLGVDLSDWVEQQAGRVRVEPLLLAAPACAISQSHGKNHGPSDQHPLQLVARPLPKRRLHSWGMTSFSAMVREYDPRQLTVTVDQAALEQETDEMPDESLLESLPHTAPTGLLLGAAPSDQSVILESAVSTLQQAEDVADAAQRPTDQVPPVTPAAVTDAVWFGFPRGITSGNCLHKILEYIDPSQPKDWVNTFEKQMKAHAITSVDAASMLPWFQHIVHARLPAGATLAGIGFRERVREMEFHLALRSGEVNAAAVLARLSRAGLQVPQSLRQTHAVRYLKGSIDLVYQHAGRFYVCDYKSNSLSKRDSLDDYALANMQAAMNHAGYWLQAALYVVALHRYLKTRLANYRIEQHLGGANYLFLRGMRADDAEHGVLTWQPEPDLIEDLDAILLGSQQHG